MTIAFSLKMRLLKNEVQLIYNVVLVSDAQQSDPVIHVLTLCDRIDCSLLGSSAHGISQARRLEWVAISSSRGSSRPRDRTCLSCVSCIGRQSLYHLVTWESEVA